VTQANIKSTICVSGWTATVRPPASFTQALKLKLVGGRSHKAAMRLNELDHCCPLELGGAPADPRNLWLQPWTGMCGAQGSETGFQKGHPRFGGRRKGSRNKFGGDLREAVVAGIAATGFIEKAEDGGLRATGRGGVQGFIEWLALNEPKTAAALFARVLPYFINVDADAPDVASEAEIEVMLKELGLPLGLIEHMQVAPAPLDPGESDDPYGLKVSVSPDDTGKK
jgi:hypothetical protein